MHTNGKKKPALARRIIGDILIFLMAVLTVETIIVMTHKINTVVLKDDYISVFRYELSFCAIFLIFALDVRFGFFTKLRFKAAKSDRLDLKDHNRSADCSTRIFLHKSSNRKLH